MTKVTAHLRGLQLPPSLSMTSNSDILVTCFLHVPLKMPTRVHIATNQYGRNKLQINMNNLSYKNPIEMEHIFLSSGK